MDQDRCHSHCAEDISVGVTFIDKRHAELVNRLCDLRAAIEKQVCRYTIDHVLASLEEHAEIHFCEEEQYMKYYGYPQYSFHKAKHEYFATELRFLKEELRNIRALGLTGSYELSVETVKVLVDWIHDHVVTYDKELGTFLKQQSAQDIDGISSSCESMERLTESIVTICSICYKIRGKKGLWRKKEYYKMNRRDLGYSHDICPECLQKYYADLFEEKR